MRATRTDNRILLDFIIFGDACKLQSSSLCSLLQPPTTSSLFGTNILLSTLFSDALNLCSSLSVRDQVTQPYKTTDKHIYNIKGIILQNPKMHEVKGECL